MQIFELRALRQYRQFTGAHSDLATVLKNFHIHYS